MGGLLKAHPVLELGEPSLGGFMLPERSVSQRAMYSPRGVFYDGDTLVVADTGNHRVLVWFSLPKEDHSSADLVLGQKDFFSDAPNGGREPGDGMYMPCGVCIRDGTLLVADSWNHRILVWEKLPENNDQKPDHTIGGTEAVRGIGADGFFWCYGITFWKDYLLVCDTGNGRVLGWKGIPDTWEKPDILLGIDYRYQWPHQVSAFGDRVFIADAGLHRVVGFWKTLDDTKPLLILGSEKNTYITDERTLQFPYGVSVWDDRLAVADTGNHRVLVWEEIAVRGQGVPATGVLGQKSFRDSGENRWEGIKKDTLCWCYGVCIYEDLILIADSGNNRVVIWKLEL